MLGAIKSDCSWFMILHGTVVHMWLCETISQAFAWNCVQKLAHKAISLIFAWSCRAKATLQDFFPKLLHGAVLQKLPYKAIS